MALQAVLHAAWRRNHDLAALPKLEALLLNGLPADHVRHTETSVLRELLGFLVNLEDQLTRGRHDQRVRALRLDFLRHRRLLHDIDQHRQHKCAGLSTSSLGKPDDIALLQADGNGCHLDGRWLLVASLVHGFPERFGQRALVPGAVGQRWVGAPVGNVEVFSEDAPVALRHLLQLLGSPVARHQHVATVVLVRPLLGSLLPGELLRGELLPAAHLRQQLPLVQRRLLLLLPAVSACTHPPAKQERGLMEIVVQWVEVLRCVFAVLPIKIELELVGGLQHALLHLLLPEILRLDALQLLQPVHIVLAHMPVARRVIHATGVPRVAVAGSLHVGGQLPALVAHPLQACALSFHLFLALLERQLLSLRLCQKHRLCQACLLFLLLLQQLLQGEWLLLGLLLPFLLLLFLRQILLVDGASWPPAVCVRSRVLMAAPLIVVALKPHAATRSLSPLLLWGPAPVALPALVRAPAPAALAVPLSVSVPFPSPVAVPLPLPAFAPPPAAVTAPLAIALAIPVVPAGHGACLPQ
mmetsp:Transcript_19753/g.49874  ORF Transcript_19753/g.49874 Transcript_19753/m.49874 type:complete len:526 (-) Transcript_19753:130-1707(-)